MWTQRDQVQAYQFLRRRLVSALVSHDANHPTSPSRRLVLGTVLGLVAALLVCAVFGVLGFLKPTTDDDWRKGGHVIVEKETGTRYVLTSDGRLHPVVNYASARLLAGGNGSATTTVKAKTLSSVPRGGLLGIAGAPDSIPAAGNLLSGPWTVCSQTDADRPQDTRPVTTALLGDHPPATALPTGRALVVQVPDGPTYLLTGGHRYRTTDDALTALGLDGVSPVAAAAAFLTAIPAGRDLDVVDVSGVGRSGPRVGDMSTRVGQVLAITTTGRTYVVTTDGLAPLTRTQAALVLGGPDADRAYAGKTPRARAVAAADVAAAPKADNEDTQSPQDGGYPTDVPRAVSVTSASAICAVVTSSPAQITVSTQVPMPSGAKPISVPAGSDERVADRIYVPPGAGSVVSDASAPGSAFLIADTGRKYALPSGAAVSALGYGSARRPSIPSAVLDLLPTGPSLDPRSAARELTTGAAR